MTRPVETPSLPRGRHAAPRDVVRESQRGRLLSAMGAAVGELGYASVAVADVIGRAGVSRKTFYEHFANKEACFLAAYDLEVDALLAAIGEAIDGAAPDWIAAAAAGTRRYLEELAARPAFARTFLLEVLAAGPDALERRAAVHRRFVHQLEVVHAAARRDLPELPPAPAHVFAACVGAVNELVTAHLVEHGAESLPDLAGAVVDVQLALLVGRETAERLRRRPGSR
jgi:AcrR family transcriptional regulator